VGTVLSHVTKALAAVQKRVRFNSYRSFTSVVYARMWST